jgi:2-keto-4-pentenoate hydratase/2-oxohepta-3-ene-1,7-dioic acid hydratase in catechol pathway
MLSLLDFTGYALALDMTARDLQSAAKVSATICIVPTRIQFT